MIRLRKTLIINLFFLFFFNYLLYWLIKEFTNILIIDKTLKVTPKFKYSEKWLLIRSLDFNFCFKICKTYKTWDVSCFTNFTESQEIQQNLKTHSNCHLVQSGMLLTESEMKKNMESYIHIIKSGAKYVKVYRAAPLIDPDMSAVENLIEYQSFSNYIFTEPNFKYTDDCRDVSSNLPHVYNLCRPTPRPLLLAPVAHISCSGDFVSNIQPAPHYLLFYPFDAVFCYKAFWVLFFLDHYDRLPEAKKRHFVCLVQRIGWLQNRRVQLFYSTSSSSSQFTVQSDKGGCLEYEIFSNDEEYYLKEQSISEKLINILSNIFSRMDRALIVLWFEKLVINDYHFTNAEVSHQYDEVMIIDKNAGKMRESDECLEIHYYPHRRVANGVVVMEDSADNLQIIDKTYKQLCAEFMPPQRVQEARARKDDVTLIIFFNYPHYEVIPLMEIMYRSTFPMIIYCGPAQIDYIFYKELSEYKLSFVKYDKQTSGRPQGELNYQCLMNVIKLNLDTQGYLVIADDLVLLSHNTEFLDYKELWYIPEDDIGICDLSTMKECIRGLCQFNSGWRWWEDYRKESLSALHDIKNFSRNSGFLKDCLKTVETLTGGKKRIFGGYSDIYYLPRSLSSDFYEIAEVFLNRGVFTEIAVPTIFRCLDAREHNTVPLEGRVQWTGADRELPWEHFKMSKLLDKHYFHPLKLASISPVSSKLPVSQEYLRLTRNNVTQADRLSLLKELFCSVIVPYMNQNFYDIPD